jgi:hypothetical protein
LFNEYTCFNGVRKQVPDPLKLLDRRPSVHWPRLWGRHDLMAGRTSLTLAEGTGAVVNSRFVGRILREVNAKEPTAGDEGRKLAARARD